MSSCVLVGDRTVELIELDAARVEDSLVRTPHGEVSALGGYCESLGLARPARTTALLSYGANASPEALVRKLGREAVVAIELTSAADLDVVYSAHVSPSGGLGAALQASPGTVVEVAVVHLGDDDLAAVDATEPNYDRRTLPALGIEAYVSKHGCLTLDGANVALAAVPARARRLPELATIDAVDAVRRRLAPDRDLESFVAENVADRELAAERTAVLRAEALPFEP